MLYGGLQVATPAAKAAHALAPTRIRSRSETSIRRQRREDFIARQLAGLRALGLSEAALAREDALLRGGLAGTDILARLLERQPG